MIERRKAGGTLLSRYVHGLGADEPIAQIDYIGGSPLSYSLSFFTTDARGSITGLTNGAMSMGTNSYDTYGRPDSGNTGLYQYTGQLWFEELQLYYYKARFYDPTIRRFLNADPIGYADGMNMYAYVGGDPVNMVDPTGMNAVSDEDNGGLPPDWFTGRQWEWAWAQKDPLVMSQIEGGAGYEGDTQYGGTGEYVTGPDSMITLEPGSRDLTIDCCSLGPIDLDLVLITVDGEQAATAIGEDNLVQNEASMALTMAIMGSLSYGAEGATTPSYWTFGPPR